MTVKALEMWEAEAPEDAAAAKTGSIMLAVLYTLEGGRCMLSVFTKYMACNILGPHKPSSKSNPSKSAIAAHHQRPTTPTTNTCSKSLRHYGRPLLCPRFTCPFPLHLPTPFTFPIAGPGFKSVDIECLEVQPGGAPPSTPATHQKLSTGMPPGSTSSLHPGAYAGTGAGAGAYTPTVLPGPWCARNMHPTTTLIKHLPPTHPATTTAAGGGAFAAAVAQGGLLVVSSRGVTLITASPITPLSAFTRGGAAHRSGHMGGTDSGGAGSSSKAHDEPADAVRKIVLCQFAQPLMGVPTCLTQLGPRGADGSMLLVIGDSLAGLHMVRVGGVNPPWHARVAVTGPLSRPAVLCYVPPSQPAVTAGGGAGASDIEADGGAGHGGCDDGDGDGCDGCDSGGGLLFLGSTTGNSQVVALPEQGAPGRLAAAPAAPAPGSGAVRWCLCDAALVKALGPPQDGVVVPGGQVGCGVRH